MITNPSASEAQSTDAAHPRLDIDPIARTVKAELGSVALTAHQIEMVGVLKNAGDKGISITDLMTIAPMPGIPSFSGFQRRLVELEAKLYSVGVVVLNRCGLLKFINVKAERPTRKIEVIKRGVDLAAIYVDGPGLRIRMDGVSASGVDIDELAGNFLKVASAINEKSASITGAAAS